jgi:hypothetical protein
MNFGSDYSGGSRNSSNRRDNSAGLNKGGRINSNTKPNTVSRPY